MEFFVFVSVFIVFSVFYLLRVKSKYRFPEGPKGWPIFGNTFQLKLSDMILKIVNMGKDYGDVYTVQFLDHKFVILNSYSFIKEMMTSKKYGVAFSGRPKTFLGMYFFKKDLVLQNYSRECIDIRKLVLRGLRSYETNMADAEELVQQELKHLVCRIQNEAGTSVDPYVYMNDFACSVSLILIGGRHYKTGHPLLQLLDQVSDDIDILLSPKVNAIMTSFPFLRRLRVGYGAVSHRLMTNFKVLMTTILNSEKETRKTCILDFVLQEKMKGALDDENINGIFVDILVAGTGTIRNTLTTLLLILASRPDVQENIQKEIDKEIGRSRLPCISDQARLSYTCAAVTESMRLCPTAPAPIMHSTTQDVQIGDYLIPEGTEVVYNIWQVLHDDRFWDNPWEYQPSRFLDQSGNFLPPEEEKRKRMLTFGLGRRKCVGENFAKRRLFVACASILQNFTILPDPQCPLPETDPRTFHADVVLMCPRYKAIFKSRNFSL